MWGEVLRTDIHMRKKGKDRQRAAGIMVSIYRACRERESRKQMRAKRKGKGKMEMKMLGGGG